MNRFPNGQKEKKTMEGISSPDRTRIRSPFIGRILKSRERDKALSRNTWHHPFWFNSWNYKVCKGISGLKCYFMQSPFLRPFSRQFTSLTSFVVDCKKPTVNTGSPMQKVVVNLIKIPTASWTIRGRSLSRRASAIENLAVSIRASRSLINLSKHITAFLRKETCLVEMYYWKENK